MSDTIIVIGSGPSGSNLALSLLELGHKVSIIDIGYEEPIVPYPNLNFNQLKSVLNSPQNFFLGDDFDGIILPTDKKLYTYPKNRNYICSDQNLLTPYISNNFEPIISHATGGLGVGWGANCSEFSDLDFDGMPLSRNDLIGSYKEQYLRIDEISPDRTEIRLKAIDDENQIYLQLDIQ